MNGPRSYVLGVARSQPARGLTARRRTTRDFLKPDSPWPAAFFSDPLVLASPVLPSGEEETAIGGLVVQAAWLRLDLIAEGFFMRGGLSVGHFHIRDGLIFGPAQPR